MCWDFQGLRQSLSRFPQFLSQKETLHTKRQKSLLLNQLPAPAESLLSWFLNTKGSKEVDLNYVKSPSTTGTSFRNSIIDPQVYPYNANRSKKMHIPLGL